MSGAKHIISTLLLLATIFSITSAQEKKSKWSGGIDISGGSNFQKDPITEKFSNTIGNLSFRVGLQRPKFHIQMTGTGNSDYRTNDKVGFNYNFNEGSEKLAADLTGQLNTSSKGTLKFDGGFNLSNKDILTFILSQTFQYSKPDNTTVTFDFLKEELYAQYTDEEGERRLNTYISGLKWMHQFLKPGRRLEMEGGFRYDEDERSTIWTRGRGIFDDDLSVKEEHVDKVYRITPFYTDNYINFGAKYTDSDFANVKNLNTDFSLNVQIKKDVDDYRAANLIKEEWVDSIRFRESFDYLSIKIDPNVNVSYKTRHFNFKTLITPELYTDRLNDDKHTSRLEKANVSLLGNIGIEWTEHKHHLISLKSDRTIIRPEYLQICWFQRPGAYSNELNEGNENLLPCSSFSGSLLYRYTLHNFSVSGELKNKEMINMIEKTYRNEEIDGRMYRVNTWVNSGQSYTTSTILDARYNGKRLKAGLRGNVNWFYGINNQNIEKRSNDFEVRANVSYDFKKGFYANATGRYQSEIIRNYSKTTAYIGCDARIGKKFKILEIYLDGRDLFENSLSTETYSEDYTQGRIEQVDLNRRCILLGIKLSL